MGGGAFGLSALSGDYPWRGGDHLGERDEGSGAGLDYMRSKLATAGSDYGDRAA